jgi:hypothetical protein
MCLTFSLNCLSETIDQPFLKAGDTWVYQNTIERGPSGWNQTHDEVSVSRITASTIYYTQKPNCQGIDCGKRLESHAKCKWQGNSGEQTPLIPTFTRKNLGDLIHRAKSK